MNKLGNPKEKDCVKAELDCSTPSGRSILRSTILTGKLWLTVFAQDFQTNSFVLGWILNYALTVESLSWLLIARTETSVSILMSFSLGESWNNTLLWTCRDAFSCHIDDYLRWRDCENESFYSRQINIITTNIILALPSGIFAQPLKSCNAR